MYVCVCPRVCPLLESGGLEVKGKIVVPLNQEVVKTLQCRLSQLHQLHQPEEEKKEK